MTRGPQIARPRRIAAPEGTRTVAGLCPDPVAAAVASGLPTPAEGHLLVDVAWEQHAPLAPDGLVAVSSLQVESSGDPGATPVAVYRTELVDVGSGTVVGTAWGRTAEGSGGR